MCAGSSPAGGTTLGTFRRPDPPTPLQPPAPATASPHLRRCTDRYTRSEEPRAGDRPAAGDDMTTQTEILRTEGLWKVYGEITAVADMTISVFKGEVFSFLGPNGAGKTTTVGMILGLVRPTRGRALVFGTDIA